jgi:hypothetical protein
MFTAFAAAIDANSTIHLHAIVTASFDACAFPDQAARKSAYEETLCRFPKSSN